MTKGRRQWRYALDDLVKVFTTKRAPCEGSTRDHLGYWWHDYRLRMPKWSVDIYGQVEYVVGEGTQYEYLFSAHNLNWLEAHKLAKFTTYSDRPLKCRKELQTIYPWYLHTDE